jgi:hypothetical protein
MHLEGQRAQSVHPASISVETCLVRSVIARQLPAATLSINFDDLAGASS